MKANIDKACILTVFLTPSEAEEVMRDFDHGRAPSVPGKQMLDFLREVARSDGRKLTGQPLAQSEVVHRGD